MRFSSSGQPVAAALDVSLEAPSTWAAEPAPKTLLAVVEVRDGVFRPNVAVTSRRAEPPVDLASIAEGVERRLGELPQVEIARSSTVEVDGRPAHLARAAYAHPVAGTIVQTFLTIPVVQGEVAEVVQLVGSVAAECVDPDLVTVEEIMRSVSISI